MPWGTDFKADVFLSRQEYPTKYDVESRIKEFDEFICKCESLLKMYASATPNNIIPSDNSDDPINWLNNLVSEELEMYREHIINRYNLGLYLHYLDEKDKTENDQNEPIS